MIIVSSVLLILAIVSRVGEFLQFEFALHHSSPPTKRVAKCVHEYMSRENATSLINIIDIRVPHYTFSFFILSPL